MPVKKTAKAKAAAKGKGKTPAKRGRPATKNVNKPAAKKTASKKTSNLPTRVFNDETGFAEGSDQDLIATELLAGGESRQEIAERLEGILDPVTRNGTEKQIVNMVSGVLGKLQARGYTVESSFLVVPPTPASKRAAARAAKKATPAPAKKTASGKRRGRPPGSKNKTAAPAKKTATKKGKGKK